MVPVAGVRRLAHQQHTTGAVVDTRVRVVHRNIGEWPFHWWPVGIRDDGIPAASGSGRLTRWRPPDQANKGATLTCWRRFHCPGRPPFRWWTRIGSPFRWKPLARLRPSSRHLLSKGSTKNQVKNGIHLVERYPSKRQVQDSAGPSWLRKSFRRWSSVVTPVISTDQSCERRRHDGGPINSTSWPFPTLPGPNADYWGACDRSVDRQALVFWLAALFYRARTGPIEQTRPATSLGSSLLTIRPRFFFFILLMSLSSPFPMCDARTSRSALVWHQQPFGRRRPWRSQPWSYYTLDCCFFDGQPVNFSMKSPATTVTHTWWRDGNTLSTKIGSTKIQIIHWWPPIRQVGHEFRCSNGRFRLENIPADRFHAIWSKVHWKSRQAHQKRRWLSRRKEKNSTRK